jgi:acyl-ACP thioesterase
VTGVDAAGVVFTELRPPPARGRVYERRARVALADAAPDGRARLDAIARWLQDAAFADVVDAGLESAGAWVVRRCRIRVERFPSFREGLTVSTFCSGFGRLWAERSTVVEGDAGGRVETVALWVHLDSDTGRPRRPSERFEELYGPSAGGREVKARLRHPLPPTPVHTAPWTFRKADLDVAGHVNNAAYWAVLEEELVPGPRIASWDGEVEHRTAADAGSAEVASAGRMRWVLGDGEVRASFALGPAPRA